MYKLFYAEDSAAMGIRVILEELGLPYELIPTTIDRDKSIPPEQLEINPNGWVPVLVWNQDSNNEGSMYECAAITVFLCDRHSDANLAPKIDDPARALYLQTLVYFSNSVQNAFQLSYYSDRFVDSPSDEASAKLRGNRRLKETWTVIDNQIGNNEWLLGDNFSSADIYLYMLTTWLQTDLGHPSIYELPNVKRIAEKVMQLPSVKLIYRT
ncbi:MAG: glutathione S-transferase [Cocleimonas sp.]|jgi:glutathione S-transferase